MLIRRLTTLATTLALGFGLVALQPPPASAAAPPKPSTLARVGAAYLARQIDANGGHLVSFGAPDIADTAYAVLGMHAAGVGRDQSKRAIAFLKTQLQNLQGSDGHDDPALLGYIIMAAVTSREDPTHFGGTACREQSRRTPARHGPHVGTRCRTLRVGRSHLRRRVPSRRRAGRAGRRGSCDASGSSRR